MNELDARKQMYGDGECVTRVVQDGVHEVMLSVEGNQEEEAVETQTGSYDEQIMMTQMMALLPRWWMKSAMLLKQWTDTVVN